jgi:hypothetical protein
MTTRPRRHPPDLFTDRTPHPDVTQPVLGSAAECGAGRTRRRGRCRRSTRGRSSSAAGSTRDSTSPRSSVRTTTRRSCAWPRRLCCGRPTGSPTAGPACPSPTDRAVSSGSGSPTAALSAECDRSGMRFGSSFNEQEVGTCGIGAALETLRPPCGRPPHAGRTPPAAGLPPRPRTDDGSGPRGHRGPAADRSRRVGARPRPRRDVGPGHRGPGPGSPRCCWQRTRSRTSSRSATATAATASC